jgi:hypothetical protein
MLHIRTAFYNYNAQSCENDVLGYIKGLPVWQPIIIVRLYAYTTYVTVKRNAHTFIMQEQ